MLRILRLTKTLRRPARSAREHARWCWLGFLLVFARSRYLNHPLRQGQFESSDSSFDWRTALHERETRVRAALAGGFCVGAGLLVLALAGAVLQGNLTTVLTIRAVGITAVGVAVLGRLSEKEMSIWSKRPLKITTGVFRTLYVGGLILTMATIGG